MHARTVDIFNKVIFGSFVLFAAGLTLSISLEEIGAGIAMLTFLAGASAGIFKFRKNPLVVPVLIYFCGYILSTLMVSPDKLHSFKTILHLFWPIPILFVCLSAIDGSSYRKLSYVFLAGAIISALYGIVQSVAGIDILSGRKMSDSLFGLYFATGFAGLHLTYGGLMSMTCLVFLALFSSGARGWRFWFFLAGVVLCAAATLLSFSRSAWVGLMAGFVFFSFADIRRGWILLAAAVLLMGGLVLTVPSVRTHARSIVSVNELKSSHRFEIIGTTVNMLRKYPVFGVGPNNFKGKYDQYRPAGTIYESMMHPHNDILNSWIEGGILSLAGYLLIFIVLVIAGIRAWTALGRSEGGLVLGLTSAVLAMFFQGLSQCYFTDAENIWLFWFMAAGIVILSGQKAPEK